MTEGILSLCKYAFSPIDTIGVLRRFGLMARIAFFIEKTLCDELEEEIVLKRFSRGACRIRNG